VSPTYAALIVLVLAAGLAAAAEEGQPQMVEVTPQESDELLANPGMGWETFYRAALDDPQLEGLPSSTAYIRWYWKRLEPRKGEVDSDRIETFLARARESGQQVAFRVMCLGTGGDYDYSPAWLREEGYAGFEYAREGGRRHWAPDLDDPDVLELHLRLIRRLGERYDGHPDVVHVDIGSVGLWGEWHMSGTGHDMPTPATCRRIIDTYFESFPNTPLLMLIGPEEHLKYATSRGAGWRADCLGDMDMFSAHWSHMRNLYPERIEGAGIGEVWKRSPVAFETCGDMRTWHARGYDIRAIFDWALEQHASYVNNKSAPLPEGARPQVERMLRRLGYRFVLRALRHPPAVEAGGPLTVETDWENVGVAPCYGDYAPAVALVGEGGEPAWTGVLEARVQDWLPGAVSVREELVLPAEVPPGRYALSVAVVDPESTEPAVRLAIEGRDEGGWYRLSRIEVRQAR
jgi:hypothetical protein